MEELAKWPLPPAGTEWAESHWQVSADPVTKATYCRLVVTQKDRDRMHPDRVRLIDEASAIINRALAEPGAPTEDKT